MKKFFSIILTAIFCCAIYAQSDLQALAVVKLSKADTITLKALKARVDIMQKQAGQNFTAAQRKEILDGMVDEKLVEQAAEKARVTVTDSEVNQYFLSSVAQMTGQQMTEAEFADFVKKNTGISLDDYMREQTGMSLAEYKANAKSTLTIQRYVATTNQAAMQGAQPTDKEIRDYYEIHRSQMMQPDYIKLFMAIVPKEKDAAAAKKSIVNLQADLKAKKTTADVLAANYRANPNIGYVAGAQFLPKTSGPAALGVTDQEFLAIYNKTIGEISDIVELEDRYYFYIVQERGEAKILSLSDCYQPGVTVTVYEYLKNMLLQQKGMEAFGDAFKAEAAKYRAANVDWKKSGDDLMKLLSW